MHLVVKNPGVSANRKQMGSGLYFRKLFHEVLWAIFQENAHIGKPI